MLGSVASGTLCILFNHFNTKRILLYLKTQFVPRIKTLFNSIIKNIQFVLSGANVDIFGGINTKHINTVWQNVKFLIVKPIGASRNQ
jgi:hypothetical protein